MNKSPSLLDWCTAIVVGLAASKINKLKVKKAALEQRIKNLEESQNKLINAALGR